MAREIWDGAGTADGAEQRTRRRYLVSEHNAKEVDDLRAYYPWMVRLARIYVPDQDTEHIANAALCDAHAPDRNRPHSSDDLRVKRWLATLIDLRAMAYWKERRKYANEILCENFDNVVVGATIDVVEQIEDRECIRLMLESLPPERCDVFVACVVDGVPVEKVANKYEVKEGTIYTWIHLARNELKAKWIELQGDAWKRFGMLFPFLFLRRCWQRVMATTRGSGPGITAASMPWVMGAAASVLVLGLTPSSPTAASDERAELATNATNATNHENAVVAPVRYRDIIAITGISRALTDATAMVQVPVVAKRAPSNVPHSPRIATNDESNDTRDETLIVRARAAYNKGNYAKTKALLDEHEATFPKSRFADLRKTLREITVNVTAQVDNKI